MSNALKCSTRSFILPARTIPTAAASVSTAAASERLQRLRDLGFDDAVLLIRAATDENLAAARALLR